MQLVAPAPNAQNLPALADAAARARACALDARARATRKAYGADIRHFEGWCRSKGLQAAPASPEAVALYLADHADALKPATLQRRMSAISQAHKTAGYSSPTADAKVRAVWKGICRQRGTAQAGKAALLPETLRPIIDGLPDGLMGVRDRALLLVGFFGGFRRSELVALDVADVAFTREGLVITVRRSKTDQDGQGLAKALPYMPNPDSCPVRALQGWLEASGIAEGAVFRSINRHGVMGGRLSDRAVSLVVKRRATSAGIDAGNLSGHSLRAGFATAAAIGGASERAIMAQTGHRSLTVMRRYIRDANLFRENAAAAITM